MKYKWMLIIGLVSLMVVVAGCGLTPGESLAGQAKRGVDKSYYKAPQTNTNERVVNVKNLPL